MKNGVNNFRRLAKRIGQEYLNIKFGWQPYVSDIQKATKATMNNAQLADQFLRDSGKIVHRKRKLGTTRKVNSVSNIHGVSADPVFTDYFQADPGDLTIIETEERTIWFSAAYQYYVPPLTGDWLTDFIQRGIPILNHLYGTTVDVNTVWQIAPWSWMADYFGNVGDIVSNFAAFGHDNLVCNYAYIMVHTVTKRECTWTGKMKNGTILTTSYNLIADTKQRLKAGPYGFSAHTPSAGQAEILAGLGLSRLPTRTHWD
jgi:hypothetical protein